MDSRVDELGSQADHISGDHAVSEAFVIGQSAPTRTVDQDRSKVLRRLKLGDTGFRILTQISAATVLLILCGVILSLVIGSLPATLGETMAVTFVIGNAHRISASLLAPGTTISATIANEFTEAVGDIYTSALIELGLILFVITFIALAVSRLMLMRVQRRAGAS